MWIIFELCSKDNSINSTMHYIVLKNAILNYEINITWLNYRHLKYINISVGLSEKQSKWLIRV